MRSWDYILFIWVEKAENETKATQLFPNLTQNLKYNMQIKSFKKLDSTIVLSRLLAN